MTPMQSVRDLLDGACGTTDEQATWTPPERLGAAERDVVVSFGDFARAVAGMTDVTQADLRLTK